MVRTVGDALAPSNLPTPNLCKHPPPLQLPETPMAAPQSSSSETMTLDSAHLFLNSHKSLSQHQSPQPPPPPSLSFLSNHSPLPPIPTNFPQSKLIPKSRFVVDGFRCSGDYSVTYFLSHFHSDHYSGLSPKWSNGIIFCSNTTARLLVEVLGVSSLFVYPLAVSQPVLIDGCEVALLDANHCPGAVQFLFKVPGVDGRFESGFFGYDLLYPKFVFPSQDESVDYIVEAIERIGLENKGLMKSVLFLVATYVIGKERILLEISRRRNCKIHVDGRKMSVLRVLGYEDGGVFTEDESKSDVHVVGWNVLGETWPYFRPNFVKMKEIMIERGYSKVVGFVPTGWTYEVKRNKFAMRTKDSFEIHLVPYSEHSNYDELREYVKFLRPKRVIPTVGLDIEKLDSKHANAMRKHFAGLVDEMAIKHEFLKGFQRGCLEADENVENNTRTVLNKELDAEKHVTFSKRKTKESTESGFLAVSSSSMQEPGSRDSTLLNDKGSEEVIQELRDCLPIWVTQNQMLDLLSCSDGNVIEAVSNFYERETEFREQPSENGDIHGSQSYSLLNIRSSMKSSSLSSGKRKKNLDKNEAITSYEEQVEQFIKIVNVDESSRYYVSSILKKTKGDINMALDIYYSKPEGNLGENEERLVVSSKSIQPECCIQVAACWKLGQPAPYLHLARTFDLVEGEKGKIKAASMLCNMFRSLLALSPEDVIPAVYLCTNKIAADHEIWFVYFHS
ncbi:DNA ligase 6 [Vitis vinifera]|uniref:DNA ligase 6 n=1 Tax=Vitis vinifera TaxID=29760 RepID=A0A438FHK5_VITVI|nr:DNA ligase 6 [Vitis vinifera]